MQNDAWFALLFIYLPWIWPDDTRYDIVATADYALYNIQAFVCSLSLSLVWVELIVECGVVSFIELLPLFSLFCLLESQQKCISVLRFEYSYKDSINWLKRSIKSKLNKIKQSKATLLYVLLLLLWYHMQLPELHILRLVWNAHENHSPMLTNNNSRVAHFSSEWGYSDTRRTFDDEKGRYS